MIRASSLTEVPRVLAWWSRRVWKEVQSRLIAAGRLFVRQLNRIWQFTVDFVEELVEYWCRFEDAFLPGAVSVLLGVMALRQFLILLAIGILLIAVSLTMPFVWFLALPYALLFITALLASFRRRAEPIPTDPWLESLREPLLFGLRYGLRIFFLVTSLILLGYGFYSRQAAMTSESAGASTSVSEQAPVGNAGSTGIDEITVVPPAGSRTTRMGIVTYWDDPCLSIDGPPLAFGTAVDIVNLENGAIERATIAGIVPTDCISGLPESYRGYRLAGAQPAANNWESAAALIGLAGPPRHATDADSRLPEKVVIRHCYSSEGEHFNTWQGSERTWHMYRYLGYDTVSTCTPNDYEDQ